MKISVGTSEKPRILKAVVLGNEFWVRNDSGGVTKIMGDGTTGVSVYHSLQAILVDRQGSVTPIYEGDTITITF